jgi:hypothetical protein
MRVEDVELVAVAAEAAVERARRVEVGAAGLALRVPSGGVRLGTRGAVGSSLPSLTSTPGGT